MNREDAANSNIIERNEISETLHLHNGFSIQSKVTFHTLLIKNMSKIEREKESIRLNNRRTYEYEVI